MRRLLFLPLFALLLAACAGNSGAGGAGPQYHALNAQATEKVAAAQLRETQAARIEATRQAGVQAAKMDEEAALISTRAAADLLAVNLQLTQQAIDDHQATQTAAPLATSAAATQQAPIVQATNTALIEFTEIEAGRAERETMIAVIAVIVGAVSLFAFFTLSGYGVYQLLRAITAKATSIRVGGNLYYLDTRTLRYLLAAAAAHQPAQPVRGSDIRELPELPEKTDDGAVSVSNESSSAPSSLAIKLLGATVQKRGAASNRLLTLKEAEETGVMSPWDWRKATSHLSQRGVVATESDGTYITSDRYPDASRLYNAMVFGDFVLADSGGVLPPTPRGGVRGR